MSIFGRWAARQRLRRAARKSLLTPAFSAQSVDCTPWVIGGLWPAELAQVTAQTAMLAEYLNADLQRIATSANERLRRLRQADLPGPSRQVEEERIIRLARESAVLRVESTVRQLRNGALDPRLRRPDTAERTTTVVRPVAGRPRQSAAPAGRPETAVPQSAAAAGRNDARAAPGPGRIPEEGGTDELVTKPLRERPTEELLTAPLTETPAAESVTTPLNDVATEQLTVGSTTELLTDRVPQPVAEDATDKLPPRHAAARAQPSSAEPDSGQNRLRRLLAFVARQQPEVRWAVGDYADATTLLVTDLAHGWIPPGITLPTGVRLLEPGRRGGSAAALLGSATLSATYAPGDRLGWATDFDPIDSSVLPRELPMIDDLGRLLAEATHWREGLPPLAHTVAKAGAAGTGVVDRELELLRVHLDTARYQLLTGYPNVDDTLLINCALLAATEGLATGDTVTANYHFAWFRTLNEPPVSSWNAHPG